MEPAAEGQGAWIPHDLQAWRIVKRRYHERAFDGEGARRLGGRWNSPGLPAVYLSETRSLATLKVLAGLGRVRVLPAYVLIGVRIPEGLALDLPGAALPGGWRRDLTYRGTRALGDRWLMGRESAVLRVPSAVVPGEFNLILNPVHPDAHRVQVGPPEALYLDPRLVGE